MSDLTQKSEEYKKLADDFLVSSGLLEVLKKYGEVAFAGSYPAGLMMHGDVDMRLVREKDFTIEEILQVFNDVYLSTKEKFRSYFMGGDGDDIRKGNEFPHGHYMGMKVMVGEEKWKFDVWFVSSAELERLSKEKFDITKVNLTTEQKEVILKFKKYRKANCSSY